MDAQTRTRPTAPWWVRATIWLTLAVTVAVTGTSAGLFTRPATDTPGATAAPVTVSGYTDAPASAADGACAKPASPECSRSKLITYYRQNGTSPVDLLPMMRYGELAELYGNYEVGLNPGSWANILHGAANTAAFIIFTLALLIWTLLGWMMTTVMSLNVLGMPMMASRINEAFAKFAGGIWHSGIITIGLIAGFVAAATGILRGKPVGAGRTVAVTVIPAALLLTLTANADVVTVTSTKGDKTVVYEKLQPGGPVWLASTGMGLVDQVASDFASGFGVLDDFQVEHAAYDTVTPSCAAYADTLTSLAGEYQRQITAETGVVGGSATSSEMAAVSTLWTKAYLGQWVKAQFGGHKGAARVWCHFIEDKASIPRYEQVEIGNAAGYPSVDTDDIGNAFNQTDANNLCDGGGCNSLAPFRPGAMGLDTAGNPAYTITDPDQAEEFLESLGLDHNQRGDLGDDGDDVSAIYNKFARHDPYVAGLHDDRSYESALYMWAACRYDEGDGWRAEAAWAWSGDVRNSECAAWWYTGRLPGEGRGGRDPILQWDSGSLKSHTAQQLADGKSFETDGMDDNRDEGDATTAPYDPETSINSHDIGDLVEAFRGQNSGHRIIAALAAVVTALLYMYVLGLVAVGGLVMKLGFALCVAALPGTLTLYVLFARSGNNHPGKKMMRMTLGCAAGSFILTVTLFVLINAITFLDAVLGGYLFGFTDLVIPIITLFLVRFVMQRLGLGDLATAKGAFGLAPAIAAAARNGGDFNKAKRAVQKFGADTFDPAMDAMNGNRRKRRDKEAAAKVDKSRRARALGALTNPLGAAAEMRQDARAARIQAEKDAAARQAPDAKPEPGRRGPRRTKVGTAMPNGRPAPGGKGIDELGDLLADAKAAQDARTRSQNPDDQAARQAMLARRTRIGDKAAIDQVADDAASDNEAALAKGGTKQERSERFKRLRQQREAGIAAATQFVGNDEHGNAVYGFAELDQTGNVVRYLSADQAGWDPKTGTVKRGSCLHQPRTDLTSAEVAAGVAAVAAHHGVAASAVVGSSRGLPPVVRLRAGDGGSPIPPTETLEQSMALAADGLHWLPDVHKRRIAQQNLSPTEENAALHQIAMACGLLDPMTGAPVDYMKANGIDMSDPAVRDEYSRFVAGEHGTRFDRVPPVRPSSNVMNHVLAGARVATAHAAPSVAAATAAQLEQARAEVATDAAVAQANLTSARAGITRLIALERDAAAAAKAGTLLAGEAVAERSALTVWFNDNKDAIADDVRACTAQTATLAALGSTAAHLLRNPYDDDAVTQDVIDDLYGRSAHVDALVEANGAAVESASDLGELDRLIAGVLARMERASSQRQVDIDSVWAEQPALHLTAPKAASTPPAASAAMPAAPAVSLTPSQQARKDTLAAIDRWMTTVGVSGDLGGKVAGARTKVSSFAANDPLPHVQAVIQVAESSGVCPRDILDELYRIERSLRP